MTSINTFSAYTTAKPYFGFRQSKGETENATVKAEQEPTAVPASQYTGAYGMPSVAVQNFVPIGNRRKFTVDEQAAVAKGLKRWMPRWFANYSTPLPEMLASPGKSSIISGFISLLVGSGLGAMFGHSSGNAKLFSAVGGILMGVIGTFVGYGSRKASNGNYLDIMSRLPKDATMRDYQADPAVQAQENRQAMMMSGGGYGSDLASTMLMYSLMGNAFNRPTTNVHVYRGSGMGRSYGVGRSYGGGSRR